MLSNGTGNERLTHSAERPELPGLIAIASTNAFMIDRDEFQYLVTHAGTAVTSYLRLHGWYPQNGYKLPCDWQIFPKELYHPRQAAGSPPEESRAWLYHSLSTQGGVHTPTAGRRFL